MARGHLQIGWGLGWAFAALVACGGDGGAPPDGPPADAAGPVTLTVTRSGAGTGVVTSSPAGIDCGTTCTVQVAAGTTVTLTATAGAGSGLVGWSGACTGAAPTCTLTLTGDQQVGAEFGLAHTVTVSVNDPSIGTGTVTSTPPGIACPGACTGQFVDGTSLHLQAAATGMSNFLGWEGPCTGIGSCDLTVTADLTVAASFSVAEFPVVVTLAGNGTGVVTSSPAGIDCGSDCVQGYFGGQGVDLTATPAAGSSFAGWSGPCTGTTQPCSFIVTDTITVVATFTAP